MNSNKSQTAVSTATSIPTMNIIATGLPPIPPTALIPHGLAKRVQEYQTILVYARKSRIAKPLTMGDLKKTFWCVPSALERRAWLGTLDT
ncbi:hypothetical protein GALMADRAFT_232041 [Galerina marginata CBS 339.88]|uniref:Uncharacterized protein n=1 Tax=Galerina marginata (strain CBS 339.88) TaxID=685588 RepID=A0A067S930_GALM3|nr:hypothetical protein GALMADRAFT_232041 [Galerina marginata CBS 339.88]